jgi:hypothetical protein
VRREAEGEARSPPSRKPGTERRVALGLNRAQPEVRALACGVDIPISADLSSGVRPSPGAALSAYTGVSRIPNAPSEVRGCCARGRAHSASTREMMSVPVGNHPGSRLSRGLISPSSCLLGPPHAVSRLKVGAPLNPAKAQGFQRLDTITRWVSRANLSLPRHFPAPCAFASWRLCVNSRS